MSGLVLSLFPGIGLLDMAFEEAGFCVVRGPDVLWGGDVHTFHPPAGKFDGVIGGPPCQAFSRLRHIVEANGYQTAPTWFLMENVEGAPTPMVSGYFVESEFVRDVWVGGETNRLRRFSFGTNDTSIVWRGVETLALHRPDPEHAALASGGGRPVPVAVGGSGKKKISHKSALKNYGYKTGDAFENHLRLQGLPPDFLERSPFTVSGKIKVVGNGVPLPMGRAVSEAVKRALAPSTNGAVK